MEKALKSELDVRDMLKKYEEFTVQMEALTQRVRDISLNNDCSDSFFQIFENRLLKNSYVSRFIEIYGFPVLFMYCLLAVLVFVFFGYKLYKSLTEKERKRDEKKKQKQLRKRK